MRQFLHAVWPPAAVVALTVVLVLQIPRKALFFSSIPRMETVPFASFVAYDEAAYGALVRKVRMSWQVRSQTVDSRVESGLDAVGREEELLPPAELGLPSGFFAGRGAGTPVPSGARASLMPPSVADLEPPRPVAVSPDDDAAAKALRADLLVLPESLQEKEREKTP